MIKHTVENIFQTKKVQARQQERIIFYKQGKRFVAALHKYLNFKNGANIT